MSGRVYNPQLIEQALQDGKTGALKKFEKSGSLILPADTHPVELKGAEGLTLDQIDARNVRVETAVKKSYRIPRIRITNTTVRLLVPPTMPLAMLKDLLFLGVEARRRLRHPGDQAHADPFKGVAWGQLKFEKPPICLSVTLGGKVVTTVDLDGLKKKQEEAKANATAAEPKLVSL